MSSCVWTNLHNPSLRGVYRDHCCTVQHERDLVTGVVRHSQLLSETHTGSMLSSVPLQTYSEYCMLNWLTLPPFGEKRVQFSLITVQCHIVKIKFQKTTKIWSLTFILASIHFMLVAAEEKKNMCNLIIRQDCWIPTAARYCQNSYSSTKMQAV